jgi:CDP-diacylglycerol--glycerol-3-phosphate 3-phosphatidyltransferase/cardiolipin synthase
MNNLIRNVPNLLSSLRLVIACLFPFSPQKYWIWLIIGGGGSDFLDGWIARRWNITSWKGRVLDAVADKVFVLSVLCTFVLTDNLNIWLVPAVIMRDLAVVVIAAYTHYCRAWDTFRQIKSKVSGKIATAGQFLLMATLAVAPMLLLPILIISILLSFFAAADYGVQFLNALRQRSEA